MPDPESLDDREPPENDVIGKLPYCPACSIMMWPGASHLDACPNRPDPDAPPSKAKRERRTK